MSDFSWTAQHDLILSRNAVQTAFEQIGYTFQAASTMPERDQRPRTIAITSDKRARLALIGPADIVFKATLIRHISPNLDTDRDGLLVDIQQFLILLVPTWPEATRWSEEVLANVSHQGAVTTRFRELRIDARLTKDGHQLAIGLTWQP